jgi:hypothetical protein
METEKGETAKDRRRYVLSKGIIPGIYKTYDEALKHKFHWQDRPHIRVFRNEEEAQYFFKHGVEMSIIVPKEEPRRRPLFTDADLERGIKENIGKGETDEDPYAGL